MAANDDVCVDFIRCLADLNLYIVVETIVQHAGYEATVNMLCVSKVVSKFGAIFSNEQFNSTRTQHYFAGVEPCPDGHRIVEASPKTEAQH